MFGNKKYKDEIDRLMQENQRLSSMLTPAMLELGATEKKLADMNAKVAQKRAELETAYNAVEARKRELAQWSQELTKLKGQVMVQNELIELESFSLYAPRFAFSTALEYKEKLDKIREEQKRMIKNDTACLGATQWQVNGSASAGKKMVDDTKKLCLRAFNMECDSAVDAVRFNNYDRCEKRIVTAAKAISRLGATMKVAIAQGYINLKIQELQLALEYQQKKQEEKERLRELRAQEREAAKLAKEIEEARKACIKEQQHYTKALAQIVKQLAECDNPQEKQELLAREAEIQNHIGAIEENMKQIDYREANQRAGYVYIISNVGAFGENVYKIGMTRRLDPQERIDELGDASVPFTFDVHAMIFSEDAPGLEAALHNAFADRRVNMINARREFFRVSIDEIIQVVHNNFDNVVEFTRYPAAEQYRETLKMKGNA